MTKTADIVIIGGGVNGLACGYNLARAGMKNIVVLEKGYLGIGATGRCGAGIRQQWGMEENIILARESVKIFEHLSDEEFVLVTSVPAAHRRGSGDYVFIDWGPDFQQDHAAAYPELTNPGLNLDLGSAGINYLLANESSGYFPLRLVRSYLSRGRLRQPKRARKFVYPVYMVYPEAHDEEAYEPILDDLRRKAEKFN